MRKKIVFTMAAVLCASALSGCQKAPEAADDQDIPHAQGALEQQVSSIAGEQGEDRSQEGTQQPGGFYEGTIGTADNKMHISAQIPAIPENIYRLTLVPNDALTMEALTALLDSPGGEIQDTSQGLLDNIVKNDYVNTHGEELMYYSKFGDHSAMRLTDGNRSAAFTYHTSVNYTDPALRDAYFEKIHADADGVCMEIPLDLTGQTEGKNGFSAEEAEQILLDKLEPLGVAEIVLSRVTLTEGNGSCYYELEFVPSYEGTAVISEVSSWGFGEIYPYGTALVTPDGVVFLTLRDFCGKVEERKPVTILSFEQVEKILEQYLDRNVIQGDERITLSKVKLEYYPMANPSPTEGEIEYRPELDLVPVWHIYMPLADYVDMRSQDDGLDGAIWNIWINAVTGKIEQIR